MIDARTHPGVSFFLLRADSGCGAAAFATPRQEESHYAHL